MLSNLSYTYASLTANNCPCQTVRTSYWHRFGVEKLFYQDQQSACVEFLHKTQDNARRQCARLECFFAAFQQLYCETELTRLIGHIAQLTSLSGRQYHFHQQTFHLPRQNYFLRRQLTVGYLYPYLRSTLCSIQACHLCRR